MKDFLLVIPDSWRSLAIGPFPKSGAADDPVGAAHLWIEDSAINRCSSGQWKFLIDHSGCRCEQWDFNRETFVNDRLDAVDFSYYLHFDCERGRIRASSSLFGILPLYYWRDGGRMLLSNRAGLIVEHSSRKWALNAKFLVEQALFNYSFQDETIYEGIRLLPANTLLNAGTDLSFEKYLEISDHFCNDPVAIRKTLDSLSELFIAESKKYFTIEKSAVSFTSGYDGRTLLACSRYHGCKFDTYSFGAKDNDDIYIPHPTAWRLGIPFRAIILDEEYARDDFFSTGVELMELTDGNNGFLQVHHLYAAKLMVLDHDCLLNGMFGSELFRAMHMSGQVTSPDLVSLFAIDSEDELLAALRNSAKLDFFDRTSAAIAIDEVLAGIVEYKKVMRTSGLTKSQQFYKYIFEETFRKFFGYIIAPQMKYIKIRSPFLNFAFIKELLRSELAGVNSDFFVHNPIKRFKGQLLYARIIEKADKELFLEKTTKGYAPRDLLRSAGRIKVGYGYIKKKLKRKLGLSELNNLMILSGINKNKINFASLKSNPAYKSNIINKLLEAELDSPNRDLFIQLLSAIHYLNRVNLT